MTVSFLDLGATYEELKTEIDVAVKRVLTSGRYILGPEVEAFEKEFAEYCEANFAVGVGNGLDALILALRALQIGPGDEVVVPSNTYIASWLAVSAVGAMPIPVEPDPDGFNLDPDSVLRVLTERTKAIMPVHLYGQPADLDPLCDIAHRHGLFVIEDAAQAHGARYKGRRIGGHGDVVCWSFYPGKNLGAFGDGGAITTNNSEIADRVAMLRNYGSRKKYYNEVQGVNSRLDPLQAAVLRVKLSHLDDWNGRRRKIAQRYLSEIVAPGIVLPTVPIWAEPVWHLFVVKVDNRTEVQNQMTDAGVETLIHYPVPPHRQSAYQKTAQPTPELPLAAELADKVLSLPIGPHLSGQGQTATIEALKEATA